MRLLFRLILLAALSSSLTSCGTASHYLGQASGLVQSLVAPVTGILRLADTPAPTDSSANSSRKPYQSRPTPAKRPD